MAITLQNFALDRWIEPATGLVDIPSAVDGHIVARASSAGLDFAAMVRHAREVGGPALRKLSFHQRADRLRALAAYLGERKEPLYKLAGDTGANRRDNAIDIDGGIGTLSAYASRGRRDLPDAKFVVEGDVESLSKSGSFVGQHFLLPLHGVAVHINAFNFPCWGLLEKFAPAFLAGVPVIAKPATATAYVTEALVRLMHEFGVLPAGSLQLICGATGDLLDHLARTGRDLVHGIDRNLGETACPSEYRKTFDPLRGGARFAERRHSRPRYHAGAARVRPVHPRSGARDDGEGRTEMHRDPARSGLRARRKRP